MPCWTKAAAWLPGHRISAGRAGFQPGRVADHHPCEQKQRGGEFSHNAKLQFSRVQRHDESDARSHHGLQSTIGRRGRRRQTGREAPPVVNYPGEGFREMTKAQWAALPRDCKAVRSVAEAEDHGAYRYRRTMDNNFRLVNVYITDMKITEIPQK